MESATARTRAATATKKAAIRFMSTLLVTGRSDRLAGI
jgi:hypothetical protein